MMAPLFLYVCSLILFLFKQSLSVSDWSRLLASGDAGGEVEVLYLRRTQLDRRFPKFVSETLK